MADTLATLPEPVSRLRSEILAAARRRGVRRIYVFGLRASGNPRPDSDVDFLADFEAGRSLFDLGGQTVELEEMLGCEVDVVPLGGLESDLSNRLLGGAIEL